MRHDTRKLLTDMIEASAGVRSVVAGADRDTYAQDLRIRWAAERGLSIIGEALAQLARLDPDLAARISNWRAIIGFRNVLVHGYGVVNPARSWDVIESHLDLLDAEVKALLAEKRENDMAERSESKLRVTVLLGGPSSEREVSLKSGRAVADALRQAGHEVFESDIGPDNLAGLDRPADVVFPVLHGAFGEDGQVQAILESRGMKYVGSNAAASRIAIDKVATKRHWIAAGIPTPAFHVATRSDRSLGPVQGKCVVKSIASGSSIGVFVSHSTDEARKHMNDIVDAEGQAMVEQFIAGTEITVGVLFDQPLPPIRIVYAQGFFDYQAKYSAGGAEHRFETGLSDALIREIQQTVLKGHRVIGCRDLSRTDVMIDAEGSYYLIEINTLPGFTSRSLLPEAAGKAGIDFVTLVDRLVRTAAGR